MIKVPAVDVDVLKDAPDGAVIKDALDADVLKDTMDDGVFKAPTLDGDVILDVPGSPTTATTEVTV